MSEASVSAPRRSPWLYAIPLLMFAALAAVFAKGLFSGDASKVPSALIGKPAPAVTLAPLEGLQRDGRPVPTFDMADLAKGRATIVNVFASWCAPCRAEMPALDALQKQRGGEDFEVVAVNVDTGDDTKPKKFLAETGVESLAYYRDNTLALFNDLKKRSLALGLPVTLLIDDEGGLLAHMNGPAEWASPDALRLVDAARGDTAPQAR